MEDEPIKRGRPRVVTDEERKKSKSKYMLNKKWYCLTCNNNKNYTLAGKTSHLKTMRHHKAISDMLEDIVTDIKK